MSDVYVLGTKINDICIFDALREVQGFFGDNEEQGYIVTPNPEICLKAEDDEEYRRILNNAFLSLPDGFGLKIGALLLGQWLKNRVTGVDFSLKLMELAAKNRWRIFLFGGEKGVAQRCQIILERRYKNLIIAGYKDGEIGKLRNWEIKKLIDQAKPDILFVALGAPLQEMWIAKNLEHLRTVKLAVGVGGTFDFIAGKARRSPRIMRQIGLEWLWRLILEPWRVKRIYNAILKFIAVVLKWRLRISFCYRRNVVGLILCGSSLVGRTSASQAEGRRFKSGLPLQILLVEREDEAGHWQLPQGGVDKGEVAEQAVMREMKEELGTDKFKIIKYIPRFYKYTWPKINRLQRGYRGQIQDLFILRFTGRDKDIKLDRREHIAFRWVNIGEVVDCVHKVRKDQVRKAITFLQ